MFNFRRPSLPTKIKHGRKLNTGKIKNKQNFNIATRSHTLSQQCHGGRIWTRFVCSWLPHLQGDLASSHETYKICSSSCQERRKHHRPSTKNCFSSLFVVSGVVPRCCCCSVASGVFRAISHREGLSCKYRPRFVACIAF